MSEDKKVTTEKTEATINIMVDGKQLQAKPGTMLIEVTDNADIYVPRFCYHKKLSIAANCRMCLVEVEKAPKPLPACATPVMDGMVVHTKSSKALDAQKSVMEFLLINHPLDCPICDQGGQCELQDIAMGYGKGVSRYTEGKRSVEDENLGSLIKTEMTRCIHCTRCVRFGEEVAGVRELGMTGRGEHAQIGTYVKHTMQYEMSGNIIDLCPVGALTSKPFADSARAWELNEYATIAPHDCIGSNIYAHTLRNEVKRIVPKENEAINETWISDRDRFSYQGIHSDQRLTKPMLKRSGQWKEVEWQEALEFVSERMRQVKEQHGADKIGAIASPSSTTEELYLLQKLMRGLGSDNIDHRIRQTDFTAQDKAPLYPGLYGFKLADIDDADNILLVGSNLRKEQPIANHRVRKAYLKGAKISVVNPEKYQFNYDINENIISSAANMVINLAHIIKAAAEQSNADLPTEWYKLLDGLTVSKQEQTVAKQLLAANKPIILLGALALNSKYAATLQSLTQQLAAIVGGHYGCMTDGANSAGAWLAGAVPHRNNNGDKGLTIIEQLTKPLAAYIFMGVEPDQDFAYTDFATQAADKADFVVALTAYQHDWFEQHADVLLPIGSFAETSGTYINVEGKWQTFQGVIQPLGEARPAWKVLRVLANLLYVDGFEYQSSSEVLQELRMTIDSSEPQSQWPLPKELTVGNEAHSVKQWPIYGIDSLVRRAHSLQQSIMDKEALC